MDVEEIEGIGPTYAAALGSAGVKSTDDLLALGATPGGRDELATTTGISGKLILEWVNNVDLMRIPGVGPQYADLLEAAGVDSCAELAQRNPANLAQTFQEVDAARPDMVRQVPSEATVSGWIDAAKSLPKVVFHGSGGPAASAAAPVAEAAAPAPEPEPLAAPEPGPLAAPAPEPAPAPAPEPVPAHVAAPAAAPAPAPGKVPAIAATPGLLDRIKRLFG